MCCPDFRTLQPSIKKLTVAGRERARWCCLCLWDGWRTQTGTSGWARSSAGVTGEGSSQTAGRGTHIIGWNWATLTTEEQKRCWNCIKWPRRHSQDIALAIRTLLSMVSRSRVRSSMAASQFCMRISEASFPHRELKALRSVEGTWNRQEIEDRTVEKSGENKWWQWILKSVVASYSYQDAEEVKVLSCAWVVTTLVLELGVPVQSI